MKKIIKRLIVLALLSMCTALVEAAEGKIDEILDRISQEYERSYSECERRYPRSLGQMKVGFSETDNNILVFS